jgi:GMP synthase-like glutamine amidotransferase
MTTPPLLLVVDPSVSYPEEQGERAVAGDWPGETRVLRPALCPGDGPAPGLGYAFDAVVLMGSRASVHDRLAWLQELSAWLRPVVTGERRVPLLGICFGHQLVAHMAGAEVGFVHADRSKELGVRASALEPSRTLGPGGDLRVVASHAEQVTTPAHGFVRIGTREGVPFDAIEHEALPIASVQFHPEAGEAFLRKRGVRVTADEGALLEAHGSQVLSAFRRFALSERGQPRR